MASTGPKNVAKNSDLINKLYEILSDVDEKTFALVPSNFDKIQGEENSFQFGDRKIKLFIRSNQVLYQGGGGFRNFTEYLKQYAVAQKLKKIKVEKEKKKVVEQLKKEQNEKLSLKQKVELQRKKNTNSIIPTQVSQLQSTKKNSNRSNETKIAPNTKITIVNYSEVQRPSTQEKLTTNTTDPTPKKHMETPDNSKMSFSNTRVINVNRSGSTVQIYESKPNNAQTTSIDNSKSTKLSASTLATSPPSNVINIPKSGTDKRYRPISRPQVKTIKHNPVPPIPSSGDVMNTTTLKSELSKNSNFSNTKITVINRSDNQDPKDSRLLDSPTINVITPRPKVTVTNAPANTKITVMVRSETTVTFEPPKDKKENTKSTTSVTSTSIPIESKTKIDTVQHLDELDKPPFVFDSKGSLVPETLSDSEELLSDKRVKVEERVLFINPESIQDHIVGPKVDSKGNSIVIPQLQIESVPIDLIPKNKLYISPRSPKKATRSFDIKKDPKVVAALLNLKALLQPDENAPKTTSTEDSSINAKHATVTLDHPKVPLLRVDSLNMDPKKEMFLSVPNVDYLKPPSPSMKSPRKIKEIQKREQEQQKQYQRELLKKLPLLLTNSPRKESQNLDSNVPANTTPRSEVSPNQKAVELLRVAAMKTLNENLKFAVKSETSQEPTTSPLSPMQKPLPEISAPVIPRIAALRLDKIQNLKTDAPKTNSPRTAAPQTNSPRTNSPRTNSPRNAPVKVNSPRNTQVKLDSPRKSTNINANVKLNSPRKVVKNDQLPVDKKKLPVEKANQLPVDKKNQLPVDKNKLPVDKKNQLPVDKSNQLPVDKSKNQLPVDKIQPPVDKDQLQTEKQTPETKKQELPSEDSFFYKNRPPHRFEINTKDFKDANEIYDFFFSPITIKQYVKNQLLMAVENIFDSLDDEVFAQLPELYKDDLNAASTIQDLINKSTDLKKVWKNRRQLGPFDFAKWAPISSDIEKLMEKIPSEKLEKAIQEHIKLNLYNLELSTFCPIVLEYYRLPESKERSFVSTLSHNVLKNFSKYDGLFHLEIRVGNASFNWNNSNVVEAIISAPNTRKSLQIPLWMKPVKMEWIKKITSLVYHRGWTFCSDMDKMLDSITDEFVEKDFYWIFEKLQKFSQLVYQQNQKVYHKLGNNCQDFVKEAQRILFSDDVNSAYPQASNLPTKDVNSNDTVYCNRFLSSKLIREHLDSLLYYDIGPKLMGSSIQAFLDYTQKNEANIFKSHLAYAIVTLRYYLTELSEHRSKGTTPKLDYVKIEKIMHRYYAQWVHYYLTVKIHKTPSAPKRPQKIETEIYTPSLLFI